MATAAAPSTSAPATSRRPSSAKPPRTPSRSSRPNWYATAAKITIHTITVEGTVAAVDGDQIVLNVGGKVGVKVGDQFNVERVTKEIKDPTTGAVLRKLATTVGVVKATDVDDVSAVCEPVSGSGFKIGDRVKTVAQ